MLASVAPLVNTTHSGLAPRAVATWARARSTAAAASRPGRWPRLEALAGCSLHQGAIAATTAGSQGVLAWWSR